MLSELLVRDRAALGAYASNDLFTAAWKTSVELSSVIGENGCAWAVSLQGKAPVAVQEG